MSHALVLLWLGTSSARAAHQPDLDSWQRSRQLALEAPAADSPAGLRYDPALVGRVEKLLDDARIAAGSLDEKTALSRLSGVDRLLHTHPALPQAAWLMAERLQVEADIHDRHADGAAEARKLRRRARALEGRRARSYTTEAEASKAAGKHATKPKLAATPAPLAVQQVTATGLRHGDQLYLDGRLVSGRPLLAQGEHHARVVRRGRVVWAGWVRVAAKTTRIDLPVPAPVPCSRDDLAGARLEGAHVVVPAGVRCRHWAVAVPAAHADGIRVATCSGSQCDPLLGWQRGFGGDFTGPPQPATHHGWPGWATYLLGGIGIAATAGFVMWRAGAFEQTTRPRTVWKYQAPLRF